MSGAHCLAPLLPVAIRLSALHITRRLCQPCLHPQRSAWHALPLTALPVSYSAAGVLYLDTMLCRALGRQAVLAKRALLLTALALANDRCLHCEKRVAWDTVINLPAPRAACRSRCHPVCRAAAWVERDLQFKVGSRMSLFETNIRILGGLLSAFDLSGQAPFLERATQLGDLMLTHFPVDTRTGEVLRPAHCKMGGRLAFAGEVLGQIRADTFPADSRTGDTQPVSPEACSRQCLLGHAGAVVRQLLQSREELLRMGFAWPALKLQMTRSVRAVFWQSRLLLEQGRSLPGMLAARARGTPGSAADSVPCTHPAGMPLNWVQLAETKPGEAAGARGSVAGEAQPNTALEADWHLCSSQT